MAKDLSRQKAPDTFLTEDCNLTGTLKFNKLIQFDGQLKGHVDAPDGAISIGPKGELEAEIVIDSFYNKGSFKGDLKALNVVHIHSGASVTGSIITKELVIEKGGQLNGLCAMTNDGTTENEKS